MGITGIGIAEIENPSEQGRVVTWSLIAFFFLPNFSSILTSSHN